MPKPQIKAELTLQGAQFVRELRGVRSQLTGFSNSITSLSRLIGTTFVTGAIARAARSTLDHADAIAKQSRQLGFATRSIQQYRFSADEAGISQDALDKSLVAFTRRLGAFARTGAGPAAKALENLGIGMSDLKGLTPEKQLELVSDRMAQMTDKAQQLSVADELFSESGRKMVLVLGQGSDAFKASYKDAEKYGRIIKDKLIQDAEKFNDALGRLESSVGALGREALGPMLPVMVEFVEILTDLVRVDLDGFSDKLARFEHDSRGIFGGLISTLKGVAEVAIIANAEFAKLLRFKSVFGQIESLGDAFGGTERGKAIDRAFSRDIEIINRQREELLARLNPDATDPGFFDQPQSKPSPPSPARGLGHDLVDVHAKDGKKSPFSIKNILASEKDPADALKEILDGFGLEQELLGQEIQHRLSLAFQRVNFGPGSLAARASESEFRALLEPDNATKQKVALEDRINARKSELELLGQAADKDRELLTLETRLATLRRQEHEALQVALGQQAVDQGSRGFAARQAAELAPLLDAKRQADQARALGALRVDERGRPTQLRGTGLLNDIDALTAQRNLVAGRARQATGAEKQALSDEAERLDAEIRALQASFQSLDFNIAVAGFNQLGGIIANTMNTMVQGVLIGTQSIGELWDNFMRNTLLNIFNRGLQNLVTSVVDTLGQAAAETATGKAAGSLLGSFLGGGAGAAGGAFHLARGGVVGVSGLMPLQAFQAGGVATRPTLALFGEGAQNEAFVPLPDGKRIPVHLQGGNGSAAPANVTVILNNPIDPRTMGLKESDVVRIVVNDVQQDGVIRRTIGANR